MTGKRIFITGGTGFFGKSLWRHSRALRNAEVTLLTPHEDRALKGVPFLSESSKVTVLKGDVRDFSFPEPEYDYILHAATTSSHIIPDVEMKSVVIQGTERVLEFASQNKNLKNLLYISSGAVYGSGHSSPMSEDLPRNPENIYGESKARAEELCLSSGLPCSIARCFAFVGEDLPLHVHFAIGNFIKDSLEEKPIIIKGDGTAVRTYLSSEDLADWLWEILVKGANGQAYNVGSDYEVTIAELAEIVRKVAGSKQKTQILSPASGKAPHKYVPDISRIKSNLGVQVSHSLENSIRLTLAYHLQNRSSCL